MDDNSKRFATTCSQCGEPTTVPFEPQEGRPVYCINCYRSRQNKQSDNREMHTAICSSCGNETTVPFTPNPNKPVYCRDCYQKRRDS